jgi:hypothetical protein
VRRLGIASAALAAALLIFVLATRGPESATPIPPGTFAFAVLGDAPYFSWEELQFRRVRQALDANDLAFVIHVGDVFWRPCTDDHYREALGWLDELRHPVIYTPGDNETCDCWEPGSGAFAPQERWAALRRIFFSHPTRSLGRTSLPLASQGGEFLENARWTYEGLVFATVDMVGSRNGTRPFPERTADDDAAVRRRTEAAARWVKETFAEAARAKASAVTIAFQADYGLEKTRKYPEAFEPFATTLAEEANRFPGPVLVAHGDGHEYKIDHPFTATNATRLEVPGSPRVGWVKVIVHRDGPAFSFEEHVVPRWKYW